MRTVQWLQCMGISLVSHGYFWRQVAVKYLAGIPRKLQQLAAVAHDRLQQRRLDVAAMVKQPADDAGALEREDDGLSISRDEEPGVKSSCEPLQSPLTGVASPYFHLRIGVADDGGVTLNITEASV